jgi:hypothetical protein
MSANKRVAREHACKKCGNDEWYISWKSGSNVKNYQCYHCQVTYRQDNLERHNARGKAWQQANPDKKRQIKWRQKGLNVQLAQAVLDSAANCNICERSAPGGSGTWHVDHCHKT